MFVAGHSMAKLSFACWVTSLMPSVEKRSLPLKEKYNENLYPSYDNYDAIEVGSINHIPKDYNGKIGVPITLIYYKYEDQFQLLGTTRYPYELCVKERFKLNGKDVFDRFIIQRKQTAP